MTAPVLLVAAAAIVGADGYLSPEAFEFVLPGVTRKEVDRRLGGPWVSSPSIVVSGQIDLFVDSLSPQKGPGGPPYETEDVHYYEYRPDAHVSQFARIVFRGREVWYAQLPPRVGERSRTEVESRYGPAPDVTVLRAGSRHLPKRYNVHRWPARGLAFVEDLGAANDPRGAITHRVVFPPVSK